MRNRNIQFNELPPRAVSPDLEQLRKVFGGAICKYKGLTCSTTSECCQQLTCKHMPGDYWMCEGGSAQYY
jgi:hypothetical protein